MKAKKQEIQQADTRKTSILLKKYFKETFGIDVRLKSEKYSMGSSLNVWYNLGPDHREVENIAKKLQYGGFDSMQDLSYNIDNEGLIIDGYKLDDFKHVFVHQEMSQEFKYRIAKFISDKMKFEGVFELKSKDDMNKNFSERYGSAWTWSDMVWQKFKTRNFVTQDEEKIKFVSVHWSEKDNGAVYFIYEVDGIKYNTEEFKKPGTKGAKKGVAKKEGPVFEKVETKPGEIHIIDYSEKAIAVIGETKPIKDKLGRNGLGGTFNMYLSCGPGWIFPKTRYKEIEAALKALKS
jgi:hypothetical protein